MYLIGVDELRSLANQTIAGPEDEGRSLFGFGWLADGLLLGAGGNKEVMALLAWAHSMGDDQL